MPTDYSRVQLVTKRFEEEGAQSGMVGYVLETYPDGNCEVEFSDSATGETLAQVVLAPSDYIVLNDG
jgi:hypothetical protein